MARVFTIGVEPDSAVFADCQKITVSTAVVPLNTQTAITAIAQSHNVAGVTLVCEAQPARLSLGEDPDATTGLPLDADDVVTIWGSANVLNARLIREGGTDATVQIISYRK